MILILQGLFLVSLTQAKSSCPVFRKYYGGVYKNISVLGVAAVKNDVDIVDDLIESGCDLNYAGAATANYHQDGPVNVGATALHIAAVEGSTEFISKLLTLPGIEDSLNAQDKSGATPLYFAASWGRAEEVEILAAAGADVEIPDKDGNTPVHLASMYGYIEAVKTLAELGADLDAGNKIDGDTPLISAAYHGYREVVEYLVKQGVEVNKKDNYGNTALYWTTSVNNRHIIKVLKDILKDNGATM